jgi:hypothetical protein
MTGRIIHISRDNEVKLSSKEQELLINIHERDFIPSSDINKSTMDSLIDKNLVEKDSFELKMKGQKVVERL